MSHELAKSYWILVGMGKTIQIAALLHEHRTFIHEPAPLPANAASSSSKQFKPRTRATLIVAPASLLMQWQAELMKCSKNGVTEAFVWHGQSRGDIDELFEDDEDEDEHMTDAGDDDAFVDRKGITSLRLFGSLLLLK